MITWILWFVMLTPAKTASVPQHRYVTQAEATCLLPQPAKTDQTTYTMLDRSLNPTLFYVQDPTFINAYCRIDISADITRLGDGTYVLLTIVSKDDGASGYSLNGPNNTALFVRSR